MTCDKIMLLFGLGKYVEKAMDLKLEYEPLNKYQMDLVENRDKYEAKLRAVEEEFAGNPSYQDDYEDGKEAAKLEEPSYDVEKEVVMRLHEDAQTQKLAREMSKLSDTAAHTVEVEEDDMDATRTLDDLRSIKEIRPTRRVLDVEAEREGEESDREIERQRMAIRAAKAREEMEEEALRRAEEERELARREEEERRARKQAEIDRERAMRRSVRTIRPEEEEDDSDSLELESLDEGLDLNNLMIEAVNDEDGLAAALDALREIHRELGHKNPVAKISSEKLNKRGISAVASRLAGKDLIIEHAAGLSNAVQNELDELMERDKSGMIVVLIDTPENLEALHGNNMSLASKFQYIGADSRAQEKQQNEAALEEALLKQTEAARKRSPRRWSRAGSQSRRMALTEEQRISGICLKPGGRSRRIWSRKSLSGKWRQRPRRWLPELRKRMIWMTARKWSWRSSRSMRVSMRRILTAALREKACWLSMNVSR